jgi:hypothetical protein
VLFFHYLPGEWTDKPTNFSKRAKLGHKLIEEACNPHDETYPSMADHLHSTYAYRYTSSRVDGLGDEWVRVSTKSLHQGVGKHTIIKIRGKETL